MCTIRKDEDSLVQDIINIFEENSRKNQPRQLLEYDLKKFVEQQLNYSSYELEEAYEDGKECGKEEQYDEGYSDGYTQGMEDATSEVKEKIFDVLIPTLKIRKSTLNEDSGLLGAACLAFSKSDTTF
jgi:flagellar biosynthesis/type III secretory pathway protein FliH